MTGIRLAHRLAIMAVVNGLRKGGDVSDATIKAIAEELRAATDISNQSGHSDTSEVLLHLADAVENGDSGK